MRQQLSFMEDRPICVLMSLREEYYEAMLSGKKKYEYRTRYLKDVSDAYIYISKTKISHDIKSLYRISESFLNEREYMLSLKQAKLTKLSPLEIMKLGYAKVSKGDNVVVSVNDTTQGDELELQFIDGKIKVVRR